MIADGIGGEGTLIKMGKGILELRALDQPFAGAINIEAGTLLLTGTFGNQAAIFVSSGATLKGSGKAGPLQNSGTVAPDKILTVEGPYKQEEGATLIISSGKLVVSGKATLAGKLLLDLPEPEKIVDGKQIVVVEATEAIEGSLTLSTPKLPANITAALAYINKQALVEFKIAEQIPTPKAKPIPTAKPTKEKKKKKKN